MARHRKATLPTDIYLATINKSCCWPIYLFIFLNPSDRLLSLAFRRWFYQRWQHLGKTSEHRHTWAAAVPQSCTSSGNLGQNFAVGWHRCKSRTFVLPKRRVSTACAPMCFSIIIDLVAFFTCQPLGWLCAQFKPSRWAGIFTSWSSPAVQSCLFRGCTQWCSHLGAAKNGCLSLTTEQFN